MTTIYKVSIVVPGRHDVGGIQNMDKAPQKGDVVVLGKEEYKIIQVSELMPPRGEFAFLHAACRPAKEDNDIEEYNTT